MLSRRLLISLAAALLFGGCRYQADESPVVVSVYDHELRQSDLVGLVGEGVGAEDSIAIIDNYIDQWVRQMVMIAKAEKNVKDDFSRQLGEYRNSLLVYAYEQQIVNQLMDTTVTAWQVEEYYESHMDQFQLKNSIVKTAYVVAPKRSAQDAKLRAIVTKHSFIDDDVMSLEETASKYGFSGYYDVNSWIPFYTLQASVPITTYNENLFLKQNRSIVISDDSLTYYVRILDYKVSDDVSPIELQYDNIKAIIRNHRKIEILSKLQSDLLAEAERAGEVRKVGTTNGKMNDES